MLARRSIPQPLQGGSSSWNYSAFHHSHTSEYDVPCLSSGSTSSDYSQGDVEAFTPPASPIRPSIAVKGSLSDVDQAKRRVLYEALGFSQCSPVEEKGSKFEVIVWPPTPPQCHQSVFPGEMAYTSPASKPVRPKLTRATARSLQTHEQYKQLRSVPEILIPEDEAIAEQLGEIERSLARYSQIAAPICGERDETLACAMHPFTPNLLPTLVLEDMSPLELPSSAFTTSLSPFSMYADLQFHLSPIEEFPEDEDEGRFDSNPYFV